MRPSFQFYPGDFQGNAKLKRCSHAERGIWLDVMCLMHDSEEYGVLRWPLEDIAQAVNCKINDLQSLIRKLVLKGADSGPVAEFVFTPRHAGKDGDPVVLMPAQSGPVWYSSRMVRDEYVRTKAGASSRFKPGQTGPKSKPSAVTTPDTKPPDGLQPDLPPDLPPTHRHGAEPPPRQGYGSSSSSSSSVLQSQVLPKTSSADADPWTMEKDFLLSRGVSKSAVGGFIGKLVKDHGKDNVINALQAAILTDPADVKSYIVGALRGKTAKFDPVASNFAFIRSQP